LPAAEENLAGSAKYFSGCHRRHRFRAGPLMISIMSGWYGICGPGGTMATQLRTVGWSKRTLLFVLVILLLAMVYLAY
jgi:hypothetical protein